jgi:lysophospholipase L1-like esterase
VNDDGERPRFSRFVALGDSTTEGLEDLYPSGEYRGWADRLAERLAASHPGLLYANLAVRGRKVPQIRAEQLEPALALQPDLASVLGGLNDVLRRTMDLDRVAGDIEAMAVGLRDAGATVLTFTFPDPTAVITVAADRIRARVGALNGRIRALSQRPGLVLVELEREGIAHPSLWCADRLHANDGGHERMAAAAAAALGFEDPNGDWSRPLPASPPRSMLATYAADAGWMARHMTPWLIRRVRGVSSGDGRVAKRPELTPVDLAAADPALELSSP